MIQRGIKKTKNKWKKRLFLSLLLIILIFLSINLFKTWQKNNQVNQEIAALEQEINNLEQGNLKMKELIEYFNSNAYIEEKARVDLGLQKQGEKVVIVNNNLNGDLQNLNISQDENEGKNEKKELNNPQKWLKYFFD